VREDEHPVVLFDGVCNLCHWAVRFIIRRDMKATFRFAALQSSAGAALLNGRQCEPLPDSIVLIEGDRMSIQSTAILRVMRCMPMPWLMMYVLIAIPRPIRDWLYAWVARNRYRWFGKQEACMVPTPELRARFL
jgi:predicted DCC family thiol-disulfide oxidoreductase YuxK